MVGQVKWFNTQKGYGFIIGEDGEEYFVHYSTIILDGFKRLEDGQKVEFDISESDKGKIAVNVLAISDYTTK